MQDDEGIQRLVGARVRDELTGKEFNVRAKSIVNACGPFTDNIREMDDQKVNRICCPSSGTHIVLPGYYRLAAYPVAFFQPIPKIRSVSPGHTATI